MSDAGVSRTVVRIGRGIGVSVLLALAACGGGGGGGDETASTSTEAPRTTEGSTTTTAVPEDPASTALARLALLDPADLGAGWKVVEEPKETAVADDDCAARPGGPLESLPTGAYQQGAQARYGEARWYVGSSALVFPDEAAAEDWVVIRQSSAWVECRRSQLEALQRDANPDVLVATTTTTVEGLGSQGLEAYSRFQLRVRENGEVRDANGTFDRYVYRLGRVVMLVGLDTVTSPEDPSDLATIAADALTAAVGGMYARVQA